METYGYTNPENNNQPPRPYSDPYKSEKKLAAGLLGIFLGTFGANKFFLGYINEGIIQIVLNLITCGVAATVPLIEGIIYLTMSDEQFDHTYIRNKKAWF